MKRKLRVKPLDIIIIFLAFCLTGFSAFRIYTEPQKTSRVLIRGTGQEWIFPIDAEETIAVSGTLGNTIVKIADKQVWVESSPCANQICMSAGHISRQGVWIACLPNNVFIFVEGSDDSAIPVDGAAW